MNILNDQLKQYLTETVKTLAINLKESIEKENDSRRKMFYLLTYVMEDAFKLVRPKIEYTKFIGHIADSIPKYGLDYHDLDNFIVELVATFYSTFGDKYKGLYKTLKVPLWLFQHVSIGGGNVPFGNWGPKAFSSDEDPYYSFGKCIWFIVHWDW